MSALGRLNSRGGQLGSLNDQVGKIKTRIVYNPTVYGTSIRHLFCNEHTPLPAALVDRDHSPSGSPPVLLAHFPL